MLDGRRRFVAMAVLVFAAVATDALSVFIEVKPADASAGSIHASGFVFEIASARDSTGTTAFHVVITEAERRFDDQPLSVGLGRLVQRAEVTTLAVLLLLLTCINASGLLAAKIASHRNEIPVTLAVAVGIVAVVGAAAAVVPAARASRVDPVRLLRAE